MDCFHRNPFKFLHIVTHNSSLSECFWSNSESQNVLFFPESGCWTRSISILTQVFSGFSSSIFVADVAVDECHKMIESAVEFHETHEFIKPK